MEVIYKNGNFCGFLLQYELSNGVNFVFFCLKNPRALCFPLKTHATSPDFQTNKTYKQNIEVILAESQKIACVQKVSIEAKPDSSSREFWCWQLVF